MTSNPARSWPDPAAPSPYWSAGEPARDREVTAATAGYLGVLVLGPVVPLLIYAVRARKSPFLRYHAATAVNLSVSCLLYALCCAIFGALLALDSVVVGLVLGLLLGLALWLTMLRYLLRGVSAANHGEQIEIPSWICARIVS
jgi:uncharacterized Tic20 family protein